MSSLIRAFANRIEMSAGRTSALGAAVGGLFALMIVNLFGAPHADLAALVPLATGLTAVKAAGLFVVLAQIAGALIGWKSAGRPIADRT